jgi:transcriptional regulator with GAF, ATPase, and Fis domain
MDFRRRKSPILEKILIMNNNIENPEPLFELAAILSQQTDFQEILRVVTSQIAVLLSSDYVSIVMIHPRTQDTIKTIIREEKQGNQKEYHFLQTNVIGWARKNEHSFLSEDIHTDDRFSENLFGNTPIRSVVCVPLVSEGKTIGYMTAMNHRENWIFSENELSLLKKVSLMAGPYLSNLQKIEKFFQAPMPESALLKKYQELGLLGRSDAFFELLKAIDAAARCDVRVLLEGESGTGKELIARAIHKISSRSQYPFVAIDCGAIPENLIESELFGHVKGAFTGAGYDRKGILEEADRGTLLMDEITNLPLDMQVKLLRVLQEGEIRILGSNKTRKVDVRIITASSSPLWELVEQKKFREDLYYRLHVYPIIVPTINERAEDIPMLSAHFLHKFAQQQQKKGGSFDPLLLKFMQQRQWTGNIRELENFVERLVTLANPEAIMIDCEILPPEYQDECQRFSREEKAASYIRPLRETISELEEKTIREALMAHNWNQSRAAKALKISKSDIRYKMEKLNIRPPQKD